MQVSSSWIKQKECRPVNSHFSQPGLYQLNISFVYTNIQKWTHEGKHNGYQQQYFLNSV